jgi:AraC family transcriptional regulator
VNAKDKSRQEYMARINRVIDYIEKNLNEDITLEKIAQIACFSPFHFHRIFSTLTNETLNSFVQRLRIEKAARQLSNDKTVSISEIADKCGFGSVAHFSRTFRKYFGLTAKEFRETEKAIFSIDGFYYSKNGQVTRKINQTGPDFKGQLCGDNLNQFNHSKFIIMDTKIEIKEMPEFNVVYCRHTGSFNQIGKAYEKLIKWAAPRGLVRFPETKTITVYHDDPAITEIEQVRQSACITVDKDVQAEGEFGKILILPIFQPPG